MMLRRSILGMLVALISGCALGQQTCTARTPEQALPSEWKGQTTSQANQLDSQADSSRYRLARVVIDPELHLRWALIANCTHPEWPLQMVALAAGLQALPASAAEPPVPSHATPVAAKHVVKPADATRPAISAQLSVPLQIAPSYPKSSVPVPSAMLPLIQAGDLVHLWSSEANVRLEMEVVSLEYGHAGQVIHLRRLGQNGLLAGVVVGKDSAELIP